MKNEPARHTLFRFAEDTGLQEVHDRRGPCDFRGALCSGGMVATLARRVGRRARITPWRACPAGASIVIGDRAESRHRDGFL